jgi:hypothetical protein
MACCRTGPAVRVPNDIAFDRWALPRTPSSGAPDQAGVPCHSVAIIVGNNQLSSGPPLVTCYLTCDQTVVIADGRDMLSGTPGSPVGDWVAVPAGSNRYYRVAFVQHVNPGKVNAYYRVYLVRHFLTGM